ncbi:glycoside hydrolase family 16 protein [Frondihabitans cladoniiphilus]|uniref:GH16 domain-containing protein n=1 Tax=Frondihabitans cladoniiphilus TaxID=715785 RepID=A0ABP8W3E3_9MICO
MSHLLRRRVRAVVAAATLVAVSALLTGCATTEMVPGAAPAAASTPSPTRSVLFYDGFDGAAGSAVDASKWTNIVSGNGNGNHELQYDTAGTANAALDGQGDLAVTARYATETNACWYGVCKYTSARLSTAGKFSVKYGVVEARMKLPAGVGLWSAFWMLGADVDTNPWPGAGEIDVMEHVGTQPTASQGTLHGPGYQGGDSQEGGFTLTNGQTFSDSFHTFAVDWEPNKVQFLVDGHVYRTETPQTVTGTWVFNKRFNILLDLAVPGSPTIMTDSAPDFPGTLLVDYVAVYGQKH